MIIQTKNDDQDRFIRFYDRVRNQRDGSSEAGLVFIIAFFSGLICVETVFSGALQTLLTWFLVMAVAACVAMGANRFFARIYGDAF
ncbi:MAG: hypothetical protein AAF198_08430 [Pseudomonadota bacterium]